MLPHSSIVVNKQTVFGPVYDFRSLWLSPAFDDLGSSSMVVIKNKVLLKAIGKIPSREKESPIIKSWGEPSSSPAGLHRIVYDGKEVNPLTMLLYTTSTVYDMRETER